MKDFSLIDYVTGSFPDAVANDSSGPTVRDGTPLAADWVNELFGAFQAMLGYAGLTVSGSTEDASGGVVSYSGSQIVEAVRRIGGTPGEVVYFAGRAPGSFYSDARLVLLWGQTLFVTQYPDLVDAVYCGDAENASAECFYKCTNALSPETSRSTSGAYIKLPDCRGVFLRSLDGSATAVRDVNRFGSGFGNEPGSYQDYQPGSHDHPHGVLYSGSVRKMTLSTGYICGTDPGVGSAVLQSMIYPTTDPIVNGSDEGLGFTTDGGYNYSTPSDVESRPQNIAFYAMMRY